MVMKSFPLFRGSRPGLFYDLSTGESLPSPRRRLYPPGHSPLRDGVEPEALRILSRQVG